VSRRGPSSPPSGDRGKTRRRRGSLLVLALLLVAATSAFALLVATRPSPSATALNAAETHASPPAAVWVSPHGDDSTCARNDPSRPCAGLDRAYALAQPGETIIVECGTYGPTSFSTNKTSGPNVIIEPAAPHCARIGGIDFTGGGDYATIRDFQIDDPNGVIYAGSDTGVSTNVTLDGNLMNVGQRVDTRDINLHVVRNWTIVNNVIGPSCCGTGSNSPEGIRIGTPDGSGVGNSDNVLISNNTIQFTLRSCQYWPSGYGACPSSTCSECHADGIHVWGLTNSTISRNRIYGVEVQGIYFEPTNNSVNSNDRIVNNMVSVSGGDAGIYVSAPSGDGVTSGTWTIAFNTTPDLIEIGSGFQTTQPGTVFNLVGNIGQLDITDSAGNALGCRGYPSGVTIHYVYNVWESTPGGTGTPCGPGDVNRNPGFVNTITNLNLRQYTRAIDRVPAADCRTITTFDLQGDRRPVKGNCDAGAAQSELGPAGQKAAHTAHVRRRARRR
jgi:parallel beta-helix repeat protein